MANILKPGRPKTDVPKHPDYEYGDDGVILRSAAHPPGVWARLNEQLMPDGDFVPPKAPRAMLGWLGRKMRIK